MSDKNKENEENEVVQEDIVTLPAQGAPQPEVTLAPEKIVDGAAQMAKALTQVVKQAGLSKKIGKKEFLFFEAWQTIGRFHRCTPKTVWTKPMYKKDGDTPWGWECKVDVVDAEGRVVASAEGMCSRDETTWRKRDDYALRSMAQTRTAGKALRSAFAWVAVLAGYAATPADEMPDKAEAFEGKKKGQAKAKPQAKKNTSKKKGDFEKSINDIKVRFVKALGVKEGRKAFNAILEKLEVDDVEKIKDRKVQGQIWRTLQEEVEIIEKGGELPDDRSAVVEEQYKKLMDNPMLSPADVDRFFDLCDPDEKMSLCMDFKGWLNKGDYKSAITWIYEQYKKGENR